MNTGQIIIHSEDLFAGSSLLCHGLEVVGRVLTDDEEKRMARQYAKIDRRGRKTVNADALREERFVLMVENWKGFVSTKEAEIPCNVKTKRGLARGEPQLADMIIVAIEKKAEAARAGLDETALHTRR